MAVKRGGLGKGLDSMIPVLDSTATKKKNGRTAINKEALQNAAKEAHKHQKEKMEFEGKPGEQVQIVKLTKVEPSREQPRKQFDADALQELAESIKQFGVLQPLLVQKKEDYYEIIAGERRWRASKLAGLKEVPVIVKEFTEQEAVEISLIENIQRENLNPIEEAQAYKRLLTEFNLKQDEVAERVAKSRTAVTNSMRLLKLCDDVQQMVIEGMISTGHARALISIEDPEQQYNIAQQIFDEKLSVRDVEKMVKNLNKPAKVSSKKETIDKSLEAVYQDIEENLKQKLSTKVSITSKGNGAGKLEIEFYSHDDLERLMDLLSR